MGTFLLNIAPMTLFKRKKLRKFTVLSQVYNFIWFACKNVSSMKYRLPADFQAWNGAQERAKYLHPVQFWSKSESRLVRKKCVQKFLLRGRMIFCYHVNRFLTVSLLSEIFTWQIKLQFSRTKLSQKMQFLAQTPSLCRVLVFFRSQTNATVSSFIWSTNYTQSMKEGFVWPFQVLLSP